MSPQKNTTRGLGEPRLRLQTCSDRLKFTDNPNENDNHLIAYQKDIKKMLENEDSVVKGRATSQC